MFKVTVVLKTAGEFPTFEEAFGEFYARTTEMVRKGEMCLQLLETACWIEHEVQLMEKKVKIVTDFYQTRDMAANLGLTKDGKLVEPMPRIDPYGVDNAFLSSMEDDLKAMYLGPTNPGRKNAILKLMLGMGMYDRNT